MGTSEIHMKIIILTDHSSHTAYDSIYDLSKVMARYSDSITVYMASRSISIEHFACRNPLIDYCEVDDGFSFEKRKYYFDINRMASAELKSFDVIFFRLDSPVADEYLKFCRKIAPDAKYINTPEGLIKTSSKVYLENLRSVCPEFIIANTLEEIEEFSRKFEIVLKPLGGYGGDGITRIVNFNEVHVGSDVKIGAEARKFLDSIETNNYPIMAMRYLRRVHEGDKRILIVAGVCLGAILRIPKEGSWLCNLAQGASSQPATLAEEEINIVSQVDHLLSDEGIIVYGIDTLVNDDGKRVLSEINTTNVGGFVQLQATSNPNALSETVNLIFNRLME